MPSEPHSLIKSNVSLITGRAR